MQGRRVERVQDSMGPGAYDPDRADGITRTKIVGVTMDSSAADRASYIQDKNTIGPG